MPTRRSDVPADYLLIGRLIDKNSENLWL